MDTPFKDKLKEYRIASKLSQAEAAKLCNIALRVWQRYEKGSTPHRYMQEGMLGDLEAHRLSKLPSGPDNIFGGTSLPKEPKEADTPKRRTPEQSPAKLADEPKPVFNKLITPDNLNSLAQAVRTRTPILKPSGKIV